MEIVKKRADICKKYSEIPLVPTNFGLLNEISMEIDKIKVLLWKFYLILK